MNRFTESTVEEAALAWASGLGFAYQPGPTIAPGELYAERRDFGQVVLEERLKQALARLNPDLPAEASREAFRKLLLAEGANLVGRNRAVHRALVDGVNVEYARMDGSIAGAQARVIDFESPENNDWLAVNQLTVVEGNHNRRPDVVLFVNGLPLVVLELKNAADEKADVWKAFRQLQTYKKQIPSLFVYNVALVAAAETLRASALESGETVDSTRELRTSAIVPNASRRGFVPGRSRRRNTERFLAEAA